MFLTIAPRPPMRLPAVLRDHLRQFSTRVANDTDIGMKSISAGSRPCLRSTGGGSIVR